MRDVSRELSGKLAFVVCVDVGIVASARHRHIRQTPIHQFFARLLGVNVNKHAVGGLSLAAVACHGIAVIEMRIVLDVERDGPSRVQTQLQVAARVDLLDGSHFTIRNVLLAVRRSELYAVALRKRALRFAVKRHTLQAARIVADFLPTVPLDRE